MEKVLIDNIITDKDAMEVLGKKRSTFYHWKKTKPLEVALVKEALLFRKIQDSANKRFEVLSVIR